MNVFTEREEYPMNERLDISDFWRIMAGYGPVFWCGVVTAIVVFIIEAILCKCGIIFAGQEKNWRRLEKPDMSFRQQ